MIQIRPELQARMAELESGGQARADELVDDRLDEIRATRYDTPVRGKERIVLPAAYATEILQELSEGLSLRHIAGRYGVSHEWLRVARDDGRLQEMAAGLAGAPNRR